MAEHVQNASFTALTSTFLLDSLKDVRNEALWQQFIEHYRPLVVRYSQKLGLGDEDAQDVAQQTLLAFYTAYLEGRYDRSKGRLRHWLFGIARNQVLNAFNRRREATVSQREDQTDFFVRLPAEDQMAAVWEREWQEAVFDRCWQVVRTEFDPRTIQAFELFTAQAWPAKRVAAELAMTSNAVFIAKHRVLHRIRELASQIDESE